MSRCAREIQIAVSFASCKIGKGRVAQIQVMTRQGRNNCSLTFVLRSGLTDLSCLPAYIQLKASLPPRPHNVEVHIRPIDVL